MDEITITENAAKKVQSILSEMESNPYKALRVFIQGGGCSGFQYGFMFEENLNDDDLIIERDGIKFAVDPMSLQYLSGAIVDFVESLHGAQFTIKNPNATTTCGCGSSFAAG